jgi:hypothetical protein
MCDNLRVCVKIVQKCFECPNYFGTTQKGYCKGILTEDGKYSRLPEDYIERFPKKCPLQKIEIS